MRMIKLPAELPPPFNVRDWIDEFTPALTSSSNSSKKVAHPGTRAKAGTVMTGHIYDDDDTLLVPMECMPTELAACVLSFNSIQDIVNFALVSKRCHLIGHRNETTWKMKFTQRWNAVHVVDPLHSISTSTSIHGDSGEEGNEQKNYRKGGDISGDVFWYRVYKAAYSNPHDLWITHWNCTLPMDSVSSGRTVVPDVSLLAKPYTRRSKDAKGQKNTKQRHCAETDLLGDRCPTCRYHPLVDDTRVLREAMEDELMYQKHLQKKEQRSGRTTATAMNDDQDNAIHTNQSANTSTAQDPVMSKEHTTAGLSLALHDKDEDGFVYTTPSEVIRHSTRYSLAKWARRMADVHHFDLEQQSFELRNPSAKRSGDGGNDHEHGVEEGAEDAIQDADVAASNVTSLSSSTMAEPREPTPFMRKRRQQAVHAFEKSATFYRDIDANQYRSSGLNFMKDALFFPIEPSHERLRRLESVIREEIGEKDIRTSKENYKWKMSDTEHSILDLFGSPYHGEEQIIEDRWDTFTGFGSGNETAPWPPAPLTDFKYLHAYDPGTLASLGSKFETAQHSWHIVRLTNPDYTRPISFRVYIQRPECFSVFPSEGYLKPGATCHLTLGIRSIGSLMAEAFDNADSLREENPLFLSDLLSEESFLPLNGFAVRYIFAPVVPCVPTRRYKCNDANWNCTHGNPVQQHEGDLIEPRHDGLVNRMWCTLQSEDDIRTIHLSTHVNGRYSFDEFQNETMAPFELVQNNYDVNADSKGNDTSAHYYPLTFVAPELQRKDPRLFSAIHDVKLETDPSVQGCCYRTEKQCSCCGKEWGARSEHLGRSFALRKAVCSENARMRSRQMHQSVACLRIVPHLYKTMMKELHEAPNDDTAQALINKIQQLLFCVHVVLSNKRADKLVTPAQRTLLRDYELYENYFSEEMDKCVQIISGDTRPACKEKSASIWRQTGVYGAPSCSQLTMSPHHENDGEESEGQNDALRAKFLKKEPRYLKRFQELRHHLGLYYLGRMQDPNYVDENKIAEIDMFRNDMSLSIKAALAMIHSPQSLQGFGVYDLAVHPGTISKCHTTQCDSFLQVTDFEEASNVIAAKVASKRREDRHVQKRKVDSFIKDKSWIPVNINDLDPAGYNLIAYDQTSSLKDEHNISSLYNYEFNIPCPGVGRFPLSTVDEAATSETNHGAPVSIIPLRVDIAGRPSDDSHSNDRNGVNEPGRDLRRNPLVPVGGLRIFSSVWNICELFGWSVVDESTPGLMMIDRRVMIAVQWLSNTLMIFPLMWTLLARWGTFISPYPIDYTLKGLPNYPDKVMRFLNASECGWASVFLFLLWLVLGRCAERNTVRNFERCMMDEPSFKSIKGLVFQDDRLKYIKAHGLVLWDRACPLFLQRMIYTPKWNRRSRHELDQYIIHRRSQDRREYRSIFSAGCAHQRGDRIMRPEPRFSSSRRALICTLVGLASFVSCSPSYSLNICIVFFCSIAMGLSVSLNHMESSITPRGQSVISRIDNMKLHVAILVFFLIGQIVGSSGGIHFLAEFIVTAVGLLLGGAATVSTAGIESWLSFFGLSSTAFWGFFLARVGLMCSVRYRHCGIAAGMLIFSSILISLLFIGALKAMEEELPTKLMILRCEPSSMGGNPMDVLAGRHLLT